MILFMMLPTVPVFKFLSNVEEYSKSIMICSDLKCVQWFLLKLSFLVANLCYDHVAPHFLAIYQAASKFQIKFYFSSEGSFVPWHLFDRSII